MSPTIQGLWIGPRLSTMEQLSIRSFLAHGHPYHLYVYDSVAGVPAGVEVRDAADILPRSRIFRYREGGSYAGFANHFRYRLLLERGGWWADTDTVCLRSFALRRDYVFASELDGGRPAVNNGVIRAPAGSEIMAFACRVCEGKRPQDLQWGETGPRLMAELVRRFDLEPWVEPPAVFCPLGFADWRKLLDPGAVWSFGDETRAVHLWHEMWRWSGQDTDRSYPAGCLYERLKACYLER